MIPILIYWIAIVIYILVSLCISFTLVLWLRTESPRYHAATAVTGLAITVTFLLLFMIPVDVFSVSYMKDKDGNLRKWAVDQSTRTLIHDFIEKFYYAMFFIISIFLFVILPFFYFLYDETSEMAEHETMRWKTAFLYTPIIIAVFVFILLAGAFIPLDQKHGNSTTTPNKVTGVTISTISNKTTISTKSTSSRNVTASTYSTHAPIDTTTLSTHDSANSTMKYSSSTPTMTPTDTTTPTTTATGTDTTIPETTSTDTTIPETTSTDITTPATISSDTSTPTTTPSATSAPMTTNSDTTIPTTISSDTSTPTTTPSDTSAPMTTPSDTSAPMTTNSDTSAPTTTPSDTTTAMTTNSDMSTPTTTPSDTSAPTTTPSDTTTPMTNNSDTSAPTTSQSSTYSKKETKSVVQSSVKRFLPKRLSGYEFKALKMIDKDVLTRLHSALGYAYSIIVLCGIFTTCFYTAHGMTLIPFRLMGCCKGAYEPLNSGIHNEGRKRVYTPQFIKALFGGGESVDELEDGELKKRSCWERFKCVMYPIRIVIAVFNMMVSLILLISLTIVCIDKWKNSSFYSGYNVEKFTLFNPADYVITKLQKFFPLDYILFLMMLGSLITASLYSLKVVGIRFLFIKLYRVRSGRTLPQALVFFALYSLMMVFSFGEILYTILPTYVTYGHQVYKNGSKVVTCAGHLIGDKCISTSLSDFIRLFTLKVPFFGASTFYALNLFVICYVVGIIVSLYRVCCNKKSLDESLSDVSDDVPLDLGEQ